MAGFPSFVCSDGTNTLHTRRIRQTNPSFEQYVRALARMDLRIEAVDGDGNCLFRSVSHQLYGDDRYHNVVRKFCMDYMELEKDYFEPYIVGDMAAYLRYVQYKRQDAVWGDDPELQAICELYDRSAQVFAYDAHVGAKRLRTFHENTHRPSICLSYYGGGHYDSLVGRDHRQYLLTEPPGVYEARQLAQNKRGSDNENHVLQVSRREFGGMAMNLDAALNVSLESYEAEVAQHIEANDVKAVQAVSELQDIQTEMLELVQKESEEELLKAALKASLDPQQQQTEDEKLKQALEASVDPMQHDTEEAMMKKALETSMDPVGLVSMMA